MLCSSFLMCVVAFCYASDENPWGVSPYDTIRAAHEVAAWVVSRGPSVKALNGSYQTNRTKESACVGRAAWAPLGRAACADYTAARGNLRDATGQKPSGSGFKRQ